MQTCSAITPHPSYCTLHNGPLACFPDLSGYWGASEVHHDPGFDPINAVIQSLWDWCAIKFGRGIGRKWFFNRVGDEWNGLGNHIVSAETMESFKRRLDKFMDEDDGWNLAAVFTKGLPWVSLMAPCSFPHFCYVVIFLCSLPSPFLIMSPLPPFPVRSCLSY